MAKDCDVPPVSDLSKKFENVKRAIRLGDFKAAATELAKLEKEKDAKDAESAKAIEKWIDDHATKLLGEADALKEAGDIFGARDLYTDVQKRWAPKAEGVKTAKEKLAELQKDKDVKKALSHEKLWAQAQACEEAGDRASAAALYEKCAKGAAGTKFAELCDKKAKELK